MEIMFEDLLERLKQEDEVTVLELVDIATHELVDALEGYIYDKQDRIRSYYGENESGLDREEE